MGPRSAHLRLRGGERQLGAVLVWPAAAAAGLMILLVEPRDAAHGEYVCRSISEQLGVISLSAVCEDLDDGATAIDWTADHAAELGADGARLLLAGLHSGADVAAALAIEAGRQGWPDVAHQILIHPRSGDTAPAPPGVAPATIVGRDAAARAHAVRIRAAGVHVDEMHHPDPFGAAPARHDAADRMLHRLASRLSAA